MTTLPKAAALLGCVLSVSAQQVPSQKKVAPQPQAKTAPRAQTQGELAWQSAVKDGTPMAFKEFYSKFPRSTHIKVIKGTLRGRFWERLEDEQHRQGVLVTVEGMSLLMNLSIKDAVALDVINSSPIPPGTTFPAKGVTFNYMYVEILEGDVIPYSPEVHLLIEPKDSLESTIVLSADGKRILAWDLTNAQPAAQPGQQPTFVESAAAVVPFNDVPVGLDKSQTEKSQHVTITSRSRAN